MFAPLETAGEYRTGGWGISLKPKYAVKYFNSTLKICLGFEDKPDCLWRQHGFCDLPWFP